MFVKYYKLLIVICIFTLLLCLVCSADENIPIITLDAETDMIRRTEQIIKVSMLAQNANGIYGVDLDIAFDPSILTPVDQNGKAISKIALGAVFATPNKFVVRNLVDPSAGKIKLAVSFLGKEAGIIGESELAALYFKVKKAEATSIEIEKKMLVVIDSKTGKVSEIQGNSKNASLIVKEQESPNATADKPVSTEPVTQASNTNASVQVPDKSIPTVGAAIPSFSDIENSWAKQDILKASSLNIISGDGKGKYNPKNNVTREEFAKIMYNALGLKADETQNTAFADEKNISVWAKDYVHAVSKLGLIKGDNGSFYPQKGLTRYEIAVILARALNLSENPAGCDSFKDKDKVPTWARGYVGAVSKNGLMKGLPDGTFSGTDVISREQAASLIVRFLELK